MTWKAILRMMWQLFGMFNPVFPILYHLSSEFRFEIQTIVEKNQK